METADASITPILVVSARDATAAAAVARVSVPVGFTMTPSFVGVGSDLKKCWRGEVRGVADVELGYAGWPCGVGGSCRPKPWKPRPGPRGVALATGERTPSPKLSAGKNIHVVSSLPPALVDIGVMTCEPGAEVTIATEPGIGTVTCCGLGFCDDPSGVMGKGAEGREST